MKKFIKGMLLAFFAVAIIGCTQSTNSGTPEDTGSGDAFPLSNYKYTDEVQLMTAPATIIGSDDYCLIWGGAFPAGRTVTLSPFIMGKYEVTQELYEAVMTGQKVKVGEVEKDLSKNPSGCTSTSNEYKNMLPGEEQKYRPVEKVTWYDACYFCNALSEKLGLTKAYIIDVKTVSTEGSITAATVKLVPKANGYRLPTDAEWEYAARGGSKATVDQFKYYWSGATTTQTKYYDLENSDLDKVGWYHYNMESGKTGMTEPKSGNAGYGTHQVGKKDANAAGLCDMSGNVFEWCYDWYDNISTPETITDPTGPSKDQVSRVMRGGCWQLFPTQCAVDNRAYCNPNEQYESNGFRVVRNAE